MNESKNTYFTERFSFKAEKPLKAVLSSAGAMLGQPAKFTTEELGWFGSGNNSNMFVNSPIEDIVPKAEDFIKVPFRLLSATTVAAETWRATEFPEDVLRNSVGMLAGKPIYKEHDTELDNWVGVVAETSYEEARVVNGVKIPGGINGILAIDSKTNPKLVRAILSKGVVSNSVTVLFDWKPSHELNNGEDMWGFIDKVGTYDENGVMYRRIVTKIVAYYETSLVFMGADPYAKMIDEEGNLYQIDTSSTYNAFSKEPESVKALYKSANSFSIPCNFNKDVLFLGSDSSQAQNNKPNANTAGMKYSEQDIISLLAAMKAESLQAAKEAHETRTGEIEALQAEKAQLEATLETLKGEVDAQKTLVEELKGAIAADLVKEREIVQALYRKAMLAKDQKVSEAVISLMAKATKEELISLKEEYATDTVEGFAPICKNCGATEFSLQRTSPEATAKHEAQQRIGSLSLQQISQKYAK